MTVELWFRGSMDTELIDGDLLTLTHNLNMAAANGKQYAILDTRGGPLMVETKNIVKAREIGDESYVGR
jgi:hypothetical protein